MTRPASLPALCLALTLAAPTAWAQQAPESAPETGEIGRLQELLDDMLGVVNPWLNDLGEMLGDLSGWHAPEFLPNGDILIRRRRDDQLPEAPSDSDSGEPFEL